MRAYRNRTMLTFVDLFTAFGIVTLLVAIQGFAQDCNHIDNGCADPKPVPCKNATCVDTSFYPGGETPECDGGDDAARYTAAAALGWYNCQTAQPPNGGDCQDAMDDCLNVFLYFETPCNDATYCGATTYQQCGYGTGPACP